MRGEVRGRRRTCGGVGGGDGVEGLGMEGGHPDPLPIARRGKETGRGRTGDGGGREGGGRKGDTGSETAPAPRLALVLTAVLACCGDGYCRVPRLSAGPGSFVLGCRPCSQARKGLRDGSTGSPICDVCWYWALLCFIGLHFVLRPSLRIF